MDWRFVICIPIEFDYFFTCFAILYPNYIALIHNEDRSLQISTRFDDDKNMLRIKTQLGSPKTGRDIELWLIVENQSPFSFGLLNPRNTFDIVISRQLVDAVAGSTLALSYEPKSGSPTGQPTGAVLAIATVTLI
ncbi:MAG: anti-sigma-K factor RskA [Candidatus Endobugula sp.]|jgi:anti-sigma-K factor RskA